MAARGRTLIFASGGYIGLVPGGTKKRDGIAVPLNGGAPVVLRPAGFNTNGASTPASANCMCMVG